MKRLAFRFSVVSGFRSLKMMLKPHFYRLKTYGLFSLSHLVYAFDGKFSLYLYRSFNSFLFNLFYAVYNFRHCQLPCTSLADADTSLGDIMSMRNETT